MDTNERSLTHRWLDVLIALGIFASSLAVYVLTLAPGLSYASMDSNELITICYVLGLAHTPGYPLYTWLGKLFTLLPVGDVATRVNLMSAVLGAGAVALLYGVVLALTRRRIPSAFAALFFAFSWAFWSLAVIAEVYAPNAFMVALLLLLALVWARAEEQDRRTETRRWQSTFAFYIFCLVFGLSLGTHLSNLGFAPAFALFVVLVNWRAAARTRRGLRRTLGVSLAKLVGGALCFLAGVAQFLWLPYQALAPNGPIMACPELAPSTLQGIYDYTLGLSPPMRFDFPFWTLPARAVNLLIQNVTLLGIVVGVYGMWEMLFRRPKRFFLLFTMYLVHVVYFTWYVTLVFHQDGFFVPSHLLFVVFIGFGVAQLIEYLMRASHRLTQRIAERPGLLRLGMVMVTIALAALVTLQLVANWEANDRSQESAIDDFYSNVFQLLPEDSVLWGQGDFLRYDMFYYRLVYDVRPDVTLLPQGMQPAQDVVVDAARDRVYVTAPPIPPGNLPRDVWYVPVLVGQHAMLENTRYIDATLYHVRTTPPTLVASDAQPQHAVNQTFDDVTLMGYDVSTELDEVLDDAQARPGGRIHLRTYWQLNPPRPVQIVTALGETQLAVHELGFGNLRRYVEIVSRPGADSIFVEEYWLVIPSTMPGGEQPLRLGLRGEPTTDDLVTVGVIHVQE